MSLEFRYARSFLEDLKNLDPENYKQVYDLVFVKLKKINYLNELPQLRRLSKSQIFYRFSVENYMIGIEVTGQIVKFIRIMPQSLI
ncbi:MAG: cytotoxic translational repressor of toxin-antitoxin stability system [Microcoleaceae cyanobacterium]